MCVTLSSNIAFLHQGVKMGTSNQAGKLSVAFGREVFFKPESNRRILNFNPILDLSVLLGIFRNLRGVAIAWRDHKLSFEPKKKYNSRKN